MTARHEADPASGRSASPSARGACHSGMALRDKPLRLPAISRSSRAVCAAPRRDTSMPSPRGNACGPPFRARCVSARTRREGGGVRAWTRRKLAGAALGCLCLGLEAGWKPSLPQRLSPTLIIFFRRSDLVITRRSALEAAARAMGSRLLASTAANCGAISASNDFFVNARPRRPPIPTRTHRGQRTATRQRGP